MQNIGKHITVQKKIKNRALKFILALLFLFLFSGCTTLRGNYQRIKLSSEPQGANVYYNGELLGQTPGFFQVPRKTKGFLKVEKEGYETVEHKMETSYRWGDSFFSNFVLAFWGAPLGWAIDLLDGTAWDYDKMPSFSLTPKDKKLVAKTENEIKQIAIAPPQTDYEFLSDELGRKLEPITQQRYPNSKALPFDQTDRVFDQYMYAYDRRIRDKSRDNLYYELKADHILETDVEREGDTITLNSKLLDIYSEKQVGEFTTTIDKKDVKAANHNEVGRFVASLVTIVPNSIAFDFINPVAAFKAEPDYFSVADKNTSTVGYLSSLAFRNVPSPKVVDSYRGVFRFVPNVSFAYTRLHFEKASPNPLYLTFFDWFAFLAGIGPELGLETPVGYLYVQLVLNYMVNNISAHGNNREYTKWSSALGLQTEVGYLLFISDRIHLRFFARSLSGGEDAWSQAMTDMAAENIKVKTATQGFFGISIGYFFPEGKRLIKRNFF